MTAYAGFADLADYINRRSKSAGKSLREISLELGFVHSYLNALSKGRYAPSREKLDKIARYSNDNPRIPRVLAGYETPPISTDGNRTLSALMDAASTLSSASQRELLKMAEFLKSKENGG